MELDEGGGEARPRQCRPWFYMRFTEISGVRTYRWKGFLLVLLKNMMDCSSDMKV